MEPHGFIKGNRRVHESDRFQFHPFITCLTGSRDQKLDQAAADPIPAVWGTNVQPFHFAGPGIELKESPAACGLSLNGCEQQAAPGRPMVSRQSFFALVVLEIQQYGGV
jgi:hypothetical protein